MAGMAGTELPSGYPYALQRRLRLRDGREVQVRPILPSDAPDLAAAIGRADPDTLYSRFLTVPPRVTDRLLRYLTTIDYVHRLAIVATDAATGTGVAVARYEPQSDGVAEVAVAVDPKWRRVGLASALIELLAEAALDRGVHTFTATYLAENGPVARIVRDAGGAGGQRIHSGVAECAVVLDRDRLMHAFREFVPPVSVACSPAGPGGTNRPDREDDRSVLPA
jgi:RimJ/RimL family protein N-acetyltransferase